MMQSFNKLPGGFKTLALLLSVFAFSLAFTFINSEKAETKILIISTPFDHPHGTHMYEHEGNLLAKCLEQTPGVEAVTSKGWPKDPAVLKDVRSIVFYSANAFDVMMKDSLNRKQAMKLMDNKVGFACIHMSTLTPDDEMIEMLGARWYFKWLESGLNLDVRVTRLIKTDPRHPISRGWNEFEMRDEIYLSPVLHPKAKPLIKVNAREGEEVVAWTFERAKGGRSFGTTLGHFHETFRTDAFRRILVNGILWSAGIKIPSKGAQVNIGKAEDVLPPNPRALAESKAHPLDESRFEKQVLVPACNDPMQIEVRRDSTVFFIERNGNLRRYDPKINAVITLGQVPVHAKVEVGLLGLALDPDFDKSQNLYLFFCPAEKKNTLRLSRFTLKNGELDLSSEKMVLDFKADTGNGHQGGGLYMCSNGDLLIGTGDNTNHMAELPVDQREGRELFDAQRTSANTASLRGKVLRIHPMPDGTYTVPPGNLFEESERTRPEIFAMGVRNGFRLTEDPINGWIYWGDVGQNVNPQLGIGPNGYDEINQARAAGNFGWPMFTGLNEAYRSWNFAEKKPGFLFDVRAPRNDSRNNTGLRDLPAPQGALIWYPSTISEEFPMLGSGGRSAMVGPVYHWSDWPVSAGRIPADYDNSIFIYDWMRNWIKVVKLDMLGNVDFILPFMPAENWRKPIDMKLGPDHCLYVAELGDFWSDNNDSQISRIVYRRGNRAPVPVMKTSSGAGRQPLTVNFEAGQSYDKDTLDSLTFKWQVTDADGNIMNDFSKIKDPEIKYTFTQPGTYRATVTITDPHGASVQAGTTVSVGNAIPEVTLLEPVHGGFFDPRQPVNYQVSVKDAEDGTSNAGQIDPSLVTVNSTMLSKWRRSHDPDNMELAPPGLQLMRNTTCFSCHQTGKRSIGPAYSEIAKKYPANPDVRDQLAKKIIAGSTGTWGNESAMPPHPQHSLQETQQMVDWILSLADFPPQFSITGLKGSITSTVEATSANEKNNSRILVINAGYHDKGASGQPSLRGEATHVLRTTLQLAVNYSQANAVDIVEVFEGGEGRCVQFRPKGYFTFDDVNLKGIKQLRFRLEPLTNADVILEVRLNNSEGPVIGTTTVPGNKGFREITIPIREPAGVNNIVFVARSKETTALLNLAWIKFLSD